MVFLLYLYACLRLFVCCNIVRVYGSCTDFNTTRIRIFNSRLFRAGFPRVTGCHSRGLRTFRELASKRRTGLKTKFES